MQASAGLGQQPWSRGGGARFESLQQQAQRRIRPARADRRGILPLQIGSLQRVTFLQWYQSWLDDALKQSGL